MATARIGILCPPAGNGNLGDEATVAALIQNIKARCPGAQLCCFSSNPEDTRRRHETPSLPVNRIARNLPPAAAPAAARAASMEAPSDGESPGRLKGLVKKSAFLYRLLKSCSNVWKAIREILAEIAFLPYVFKQARRLDLLVVAGSGQLCDHFGGPWNLPYTIFKWSLAAKFARARLAFLSNGAGPLDASLSRFFVKRALSLADYKSFRDETSKALVVRLGAFSETPVYPDLAYSLQLPAPIRVEKPKGITVGINPFPHFDFRYWPVADQEAYMRYVSVMASFASWLLGQGHFIFFFPTQVRADPRVIADIERLLRAGGAPGLEDRLLRIQVSDLKELLSQVAIADLIVATRFHALVFSFLLNKPVLTIANHHKMSDLMSSMGQSEYLLDVRGLDLDALIRQFNSLKANAELARGKVRDAVSRISPALERQYEEVLRIVKAK